MIDEFDLSEDDEDLQLKKMLQCEEEMGLNLKTEEQEELLEDKGVLTERSRNVQQQDVILISKIHEVKIDL
jgi:hypothetical protein